MDTIEIVRTVVGVFFILFGLGTYAYDKRHHMKYSEFRYSPIDWLICMLTGVLAGAITVRRGIIFVIAAIILWIVVKVVIVKLDEKKEQN
ncbi:hypothetical protein [Terrisporobacter glycolicus]|uniref:Uncharacterized protein n=1 Tax=Terrisporobacter glycolicus ATCC 14880 = DSM 1288 TaxID=1121315 RepID=A0ABZ2F018_9FIRM|nr:hypothetical protein [Terrisporobacter glycolicus]